MGGEFDRQVETLLGLGYPEVAGLSEAEFRGILSPLAAPSECVRSAARESGGPAFVLVVRSTLVPVADAMERASLNGKHGFADLNPRSPGDFRPIAGVRLPTTTAYLVTGIDTGLEFRNVTPEAALREMVTRGRSPLTIEEGISVLTQFPELLRKNACFSLPGSRCGDQRVPALWISGGRPRLGWCWDRNPHSWLGAASCARRVGPN